MPDDVTNPPLTWLLALLAVVILVGPIVWALVRGRKSGVPDHEDPRGDMGWVAMIREHLTRQKG